MKNFLIITIFTLILVSFMNFALDQLLFELELEERQIQQFRSAAAEMQRAHPDLAIFGN